MRFSSRTFLWVSVGILLLSLSGLAWAATEADVRYIKAKIEAGEMLSAADIRLAEDINATTGSHIDIEMALERAKAVQAGVMETPRPPREPLDEYIWTPVTYDWVDITGIGTNTGITTDDGNAGPFTLGFTFPFYDNNFTTVRVSANGFLSFTTSSTGFWGNTAIPATAEPNNALCLFWDDMSPDDGGSILYYADAANQRFIVSWEGIYHIDGGGPYYFQAIIESSGNVVYQYQTIAASDPGNTSCTVGIENATGTQAVQVCYNGAGTLPTSGWAIMIGQPDGVPMPVANLEADQVGADVVLTWTDPTQDTNGNPIVVDSLVVQMGATRLGRVNAGVQTFTHPNAPDGNLMYSVIAYNDGYGSSPSNVGIVVGNFGYFNDFEDNDGGWVSSGGWERGTPTGAGGPTGAYSGANCLGTVISGDYANNACYSMDLDMGFVVMNAAATVEFWAWFDTELNYDGCNFKVSLDGGSTWEVVTPTGGYPGSTNTSQACMPSQPAWTGHDIGEMWHYVVIPVGQYVGLAPIFRFQLGSDGSVPYPGYYIDDLIMWGVSLPSGMPRPVTDLTGDYVEPNAVLTWTDPTLDTDGNPIQIDNVEVWWGPVNTGILLATVNPGVQTYTHVSPPAGIHTYNVRPFNDPYFGLPMSVDIVVGTPTYLEGFEVRDGMWVPDPATGGWEWGTPSGEGPGNPHDGHNCWGTVLSGNYSNSACWHVDLDLGLVVESPTATVEFWAWYNTETNWDGCHFKASLDGGATWELVTPDGGYPQPSVNNTCIGTGVPCWAGNSNGWIYMVVPVGHYLGEAPIFRFTFGSDGSGQYPGFYFDDMVIWGLEAARGAPVSGTVTLNGGSGNVASVTVRANGIGSPSTHPAANGTYTLTDVQVGDRIITAELNGYVTQNLPLTVPEDGVTGFAIQLNRVPPPAPTNLTGTIIESGEVHLDWDNSTDAQVDRWYVYRKMREDQTWVYQFSVPTSSAAQQLPSPGIWRYAVTAVDSIGPSSPVESPLSDHVEFLYGELPPTHLSANGSFDDRIRLRWLEPGVQQPPMQIFYDDSTSETWYRVNTPNGPTDYFAVRFTPPTMDTVSYPLPVQSANIYMERSDPLPNVWICPDAGGLPDMDNAYMNFTEIGADGTPGWLIANTEGAVELPDNSDFWVVWQFPPDATGPGTGADNSEPDLRSYWSQGTGWNQWTSNDWMCRVWVGSPQARMFVMSVGGSSGYAAEEVPSVSIMDYANAAADKKSSAGPVRQTVTPPDWSSWVPGTVEMPYSKAPALDFSYRDHRRTLDEWEYYIVYRDGADIAHATDEVYEDFVAEGIEYDYHVTAWYDNDVESGPTGTVSAMAAMAPGAPQNVTGASVNSTQIRIEWTDPVVNADGTPCVDLASLNLYRDGVELGHFSPGEGFYVDTPPQPNRTYQWTVRAFDEVPNEGPAGAFTGSVVLPWMEADYDWVDITGVGTNTGLTADDGNAGPFPLGFDFNFYGTTYNSIRVLSNGLLSFTTSATGFWTNTEIPNPAEPNAALYLYWHDMYPPDGGSILYYADAANQRFIVSWEGVNDYDENGPHTYQAILGADGSLTFQYNTVTDAGNLEATVGIENATGTDAFQLWYNGAGDFTPISGSAVQFWGPPPVYANVSGTVTLDGGSGTMTSAVVRANGVSRPSTHPAADGTYTLQDVQVGNRTFICELDGYNTVTRAVTVPEGGLTNENFTLRRVDPPAPTNLTASVNTGTGEVTLNWDDSPDLLVDAYRLYRKLREDAEWVLSGTVNGRTNSQTTETLTVSGIYQYQVTAIDNDVVAPPVESVPSAYAEVLYGELPPQMLTANGNFDNRIALSWLEPGTPPEVELYYDSSDVDYEGCVTDGLGFTSQFPFAWFAGHYQTAGTVTITRIRTRHWPSSTPGCPV
ncbi:MAG: immune inhibitor A, partial [bacterium]|nr:immune inhibitor A [bacterium]